MNIFVAGGLVLALLAGAPATAQTGAQILPAEMPTTNPWRACSSKTPDRYYPRDAQRRNIEGFARVQCRLNDSGRLTACSWYEESAPDLGFGDAATQLACLMKFTPRTQGAFTPGSVALIPIRFTLPPRR